MNLRDEQIVFFDCPPDLCIGIAAVIGAVALVPINMVSISCLTIQVYGYYVFARNHERAIRYRLNSNVPFGILLDHDSVKKALPKIRDKPVRKIARMKNYLVLDFGELRVGVRRYEPKYEHPTNEMFSIESGTPYEQEQNEILRGYRKKYRTQERDVLESYYMISEFNEIFCEPCVPLFRVPRDLKKTIKPGLYADTFSVTFNRNTLTIKASIEGGLSLRKKWIVTKYGPDAENITLTVDSRCFFKSIDDEGLIGYRPLFIERNTYLIYIHNKRTDYILLCSTKEK